MADYTTDEAAAMTGTARTQVDYMVRIGVVVPAIEAPRRGMNRRFDSKNLVEIAVGGELFDAGISAIKVGEALDKVRRHWKRLADPEHEDAGLVLSRSPGDSRPNRDELQRSANLLVQIGAIPGLLETLLRSGYTVHAAINVKWIIKQVRRITGEGDE